jgi:hypothetical protein
MRHVKSFAAGFVSTLVFHQGLLLLILLAAGESTARVWSLSPVPPLNVPAVISLAFWGGLWGIVLWLFIATSRGSAYWIKATLIGAVAPSAVAWFVVMPMKGMGFAGGWDPKIIIGALLVNAAWGFGVALLMRLINRISK